MKSVEMIVYGCLSNRDWPSSSPRSSRDTVEARTSSASMPNFSRSSPCHCSASDGEHSTASRVASPCASSSLAMSPASIVLPMPTSSEISSRTVRCRSAISSGTSWYARGSTAIDARERNGPAPERKPMRSAVRSRPAARWSPRSDGLGGANSAGRTSSKEGKTAAMSSSLPPRGRSTSMSAALSGSTTHSRPRAATSEPAVYVRLMRCLGFWRFGRGRRGQRRWK